MLNLGSYPSGWSGNIFTARASEMGNVAFGPDLQWWRMSDKKGSEDPPESKSEYMSVSEIQTILRNGKCVFDGKRNLQRSIALRSEIKI